MFPPRGASVTSQVVPQQLILGGAGNHNKRDSAISLKARHSSRDMAPVYRLYPNQSNGRNELRAMDRDSIGSQPRSHTSASSSRDRGRGSKVNSVDTAIFLPSGEAMNEYQSEDFQKRYHARRSVTQSESTIHRTKSIHSPASEHAPTSPDFTDMDDGTGQPIASVPAPTGTPKRGVHIPTRTRYGYTTETPPRNQAGNVTSTDFPSSSSSGGGNRPALPQSIPSQPSMSSPAPAPRDRQPGSAFSEPPSPETDNAYDPGARSSGDSVFSQQTAATSVHTLPALQTKGPDNGDNSHLEPVLEDDPGSWDLVGPAQDDQELGMYTLEKRAEQLLSAEHLRTIFDDPKLLLKFTGFLNSHRPKSIPILIYYLDALKALRAINYANAIAEALEPIKGQAFTEVVAKPTGNSALEEKANRAFEVLVQEDLPAYIAHTWIQVVSISIQRRITGTLAPHLREASEGLAEVFCLTDPSRTDNPIVFASEEFTRTTQYGMNYIIGRNCRFLQGPRTSPHSVRRLAIACSEGKELTEVFVNYRRDGSPFMNLLMTAPLMDSRGNIRYFIGAQVDVSGLIKDSSEMDGLTRMVEREQDPEGAAEEDEANHKDEFQELSEMFNGAELDTVKKCGGRMHKEYVDESDRESVLGGRPRLLLKDLTQDLLDKEKTSMAESIASMGKEQVNGRLEGIYQHYLLIRPAPSLRILFTSPSLRVPGILQSPFLNRIGGSSRVRADLRAALADGRGVTAKIRWLSKPDEDGEGEGRPRWIHCTPLLGHTGTVGVWMIVLVDDESASPGNPSGKRFRQAPPVSNNIGGKEWDATRSLGRKQLNAYDKDSERRGGGRTEQYSRPGSRNTSLGASPMPNRNAERSNLVTSANASEFSFNLKG